MTKNIDFSRLDRAYQKHKKEYDDAVIKTLESGWYVLGENVSMFEKEFSKYIGAKYCVGLNSGLDALILAFRALGIGAGDEVIVPANTYIASALGITENGATPVFVEPDDFYNLDAELIEERITHKTKAILAVHLYGQAANMARIKGIADRHNLFLIEDCAQSHGSKFNGKTTGAWGDVGCFSFYPTKNIGAFGDAGAIVTNSKDTFDKIKMLRNYGSREKYVNEITGVNSRLDEIQASLIRIRLKYYNEAKAEREKIAHMYLEGIKNEKIILPKIREGAEHVWHLFVIQTEYRDQLMSFLAGRNIGTQIHYPIPPHLSGAYENYRYKTGDFTKTERYAETILSLPLFEGMKDEEVEYVIRTTNEFGKG